MATPTRAKHKFLILHRNQKKPKRQGAFYIEFECLWCHRIMYLERILLHAAIRGRLTKEWVLLCREAETQFGECQVKAQMLEAASRSEHVE